VAVSNPGVLDDSLVDLTPSDKSQRRIVVHAYGAGNEPWDLWKPLTEGDPAASATASSPSSAVKDRNAYERLKEQSTDFLYRSVSRALDIPVEEVKTRAEVTMSGSPITHARFTRRYEGTYGATFDDMLPDSLTPVRGLYLCGDR
jgi:phytoene dehydrogenase-like protein